MAKTRTARGTLALVVMFGLAGCEENIFDGRMPAADAPLADARGVITYPTYQVAVAQSGDTVRLMAERLGQDPDEMARLNGIHPDAALRTGEVLVLPNQIETIDPAGHIGDPGSRPGTVDIQTLAGDAIDRAAPQTRAAQADEPIFANLQPLTGQKQG